MSLLIGVFLFIYICWIIYKKYDLLKPSILFTIIILSTYFITCLRFSELISIYPFWFSFLIFLSIIVFLLGTRTANHFKISVKRQKVSYSKNTMRQLSFVYFIIIILSFFITIHYLGAPPAISKIDRSEYFVSGWGTILMTEIVFFALILFDHYNQKAIGKEFWIYITLIFLISFLLSNKFQIIYIMILFLIAYNSYRKKIKIKQFIILSFIIIGLFAFLYRFVYSSMYGISQDMLYQGYRMRLPHNLHFLIQPYNYIAFNYENLYNFLISNTHPLYGLKTFGSVLEIFYLDRLFPSSITIYLNEWKNLLAISSMTTGTMFEDFVQDGGIIFMLIMTYLLGIFSQFTFTCFRKNKNFVYFFLYSITTTSIFMAFFSNVFTSKMTIVNIIVVLFINRLLKVEFVFGGKDEQKIGVV